MIFSFFARETFANALPTDALTSARATTENRRILRTGCATHGTHYYPLEEQLYGYNGLLRKCTIVQRYNCYRITDAYLVHDEERRKLGVNTIKQVCEKERVREKKREREVSRRKLKIKQKCVPAGGSDFVIVIVISWRGIVFGAVFTTGVLPTDGCLFECHRGLLYASLLRTLRPYLDIFSTLLLVNFTHTRATSKLYTNRSFQSASKDISKFSLVPVLCVHRT